MHQVLSMSFISDFLLTSIRIDNRATVFELIENKPSIKIITDKGYIDTNLKNQLENKKDILLISLKRKNSKNSLDKVASQHLVKDE